MKLTEKLDILQSKHMGAWLKTRVEVRNELSMQYPIFCVCGRLCTGFHESNCRKFQNRVTAETVKRLEGLLK